MDIKDGVRSALTDDLLKPIYKGRPWPTGHCYIASEAYYHLVPGCKAFHVKHEGSVHWFLRKDSQVIDLTDDQFTTSVPYELGVPCGFLTKEPSKRARTVINRVRADQRP